MNHKALGSFWGKWDLHFHTPSSYDYKNGTVTNDQIVAVLIQNDIQVVAITDHHFIDTQRIKDLKKIAGDRLAILPGIEFRSDLGGRESVHFIGIFPEGIDIDDLWTKLSGQLGITPRDIKALTSLDIALSPPAFTAVTTK